jgi:hypothetical protein
MTRAAVIAILLALGGAGDQRVPAGPAVRLHHLHFRVASIAPALAEAARTQGGTRVILQGLGVGVRVRDFYLLFDDRAPVEVPDNRLTGGADAVRAAVEWLREHGITVDVPAGAPPAGGMTGDQALDHVGFAAADPAAVAARLSARGLEPLRRTSDSVFFEAGGFNVEITRDTDLPDAMWCPMHPDVRSAVPGKCPICAMDLVPIPPPGLGEYRVEIVQERSTDGRGVRALRLRIRDPRTDAVTTEFTPIHERLLHLFIVSRSLRLFAHEHPVREGDGFALAVRLPPGAYMLIADFLPAGGSPQLVHQAIVTAGYAGSPFVRVPRIQEDLAAKTVDGLRARLETSMSKGGTKAVLRLVLTDAASGAAATDLEPYLGAAGHLLIVNADLTQAVHAHPEAMTSGPDITFDVEFPSPGTFKLWAQVQRRGRVMTFPFVVRIK